jgi:hypothetical protein
MMGMGFLRLNKMLAKHKWHRKEIEEEESQEHRESSLAVWLVVMALLVVSILFFGIRHASQFI